MPNFALSDDVFFEAARRFPTPFHLYDENGLRQRVRALRKAFSAVDYREYFAVKALPNPAILRIMKEEGCGLDCSSECELLLAQRVGVTGKSIMFSANAQPAKEFALARSLGAYINLDDLSDVETLAANGGIPEEMCFRYNPGGELTQDAAIMGQPEESKYGFMRAQLTEGIRKCKALGMKRFGLYAFLSSNTLVTDYYPALAGLLCQTGRALEKETGAEFVFINLSGGIGVPYHPQEEQVDIMQVGAGVARALKGHEGLRVYSELGRYMTAPYGWLVSTVTHEKKIYKDYLGLDACASCLMRPAMYGAYHHIHLAGKRNEKADTLYDVTGALCENNDKFAVDRMLPRAQIGDLCIIHDTGAHGLAMGYQYNGRLRCAEILYTADGDFRLIRRAETPEDYFATIEWEAV